MNLFLIEKFKKIYNENEYVSVKVYNVITNTILTMKYYIYEIISIKDSNNLLKEFYRYNKISFI